MKKINVQKIKQIRSYSVLIWKQRNQRSKLCLYVTEPLQKTKYKWPPGRDWRHPHAITWPPRLDLWPPRLDLWLQAKTRFMTPSPDSIYDPKPRLDLWPQAKTRFMTPSQGLIYDPKTQFMTPRLDLWPQDAIYAPKTWFETARRDLTRFVTPKTRFNYFQDAVKWPPRRD